MRLDLSSRQDGSGGIHACGSGVGFGVVETWFWKQPGMVLECS